MAQLALHVRHRIVGRQTERQCPFVSAETADLIWVEINRFYVLALTDPQGEPGGVAHLKRTCAGAVIAGDEISDSLIGQRFAEDGFIGSCLWYSLCRLCLNDQGAIGCGEERDRNQNTEDGKIFVHEFLLLN